MSSAMTMETMAVNGSVAPMRRWPCAGSSSARISSTTLVQQRARWTELAREFSPAASR
jgi:hypothetical protein